MTRSYPFQALERISVRFPLPSAVVLSLLLMACGETEAPMGPVDPGPTEPASPPANMNAYLGGMPSWEAFSPLLTDFDGAVGEPSQFEEMVDDVNYSCTTTPYSLTQTPEKVVTLNPDVEILWPGSLLQGSGYVGGIGSLAELPIRQRAPIRLSIDLLGDDNFAAVDDPTLGSVTAAVGSLIQAATDAGHRAGNKIFYNQEDYHALAEASVRAGLSANYQGVTVKASLEASAGVEKSTVMAVYTQQMFTVSMELPQTPGALFSDELTEELLQEQVALDRIGPDNLPVFVSSIVYGRTVVFSMTATGTHAELKAALSVAVGEQGGELSTEQRALLETSEINLVAIGGDAANASSVIRSGDFSSYFEEDADLTTARPISYTVRNVADNSTARVSETTNYDLRQCAADDIPVTGATYRIRMVDAKYVERGSSLLCRSRLALGVLLGASVFQVAGPYENNVSGVRDLFRGVTAASLQLGEVYQFPANGLEVNLHYDGRDEVTLGGRIAGQSLGVPFWSLAWDWNPPITFKGVIPEGFRGTSRWGGSFGGNCGRVQVRYHIDRIADLND